MVLPKTIHDASPHDPLLLLPLPSHLPSSPLPDLQPLVDALVTAINDPQSSSVGLGVLATHMRRITRHSQILLNAARTGSSEAREKLDKGDVELRETEYERERVREEIEKCMDYAPTYKDLPLPDTDTFLSNADPDILKNLPNPDDNSYPYALTTARLEQELADVIKLEGQLAQLTKDREAVIKAKKEIKSKFDAVDVYLTDFAKTTNAVASKIKDVAKVPLP